LANIKFSPLSPEAGFFPLTFFSLFAILSSAFAFTLYLDFFDEVNSALSFQTILFSRFSFLPLFLPLVGGSVNRFSSGALLMYQLSPGLSSVLPKYFKVFLKPYTVRVSARKHRSGIRWLIAL
jgi:hypothetical protein